MCWLGQADLYIMFLIMCFALMTATTKYNVSHFITVQTIKHQTNVYLDQL